MDQQLRRILQQEVLHPVVVLCVPSIWQLCVEVNTLRS